MVRARSRVPEPRRVTAVRPPTVGAVRAPGVIRGPRGITASRKGADRFQQRTQATRQTAATDPMRLYAPKLPVSRSQWALDFGSLDNIARTGLFMKK